MKKLNPHNDRERVALVIKLKQYLKSKRRSQEGNASLLIRWFCASSFSKFKRDCATDMNQFSINTMGADDTIGAQVLLTICQAERRAPESAIGKNRQDSVGGQNNTEKTRGKEPPEDRHAKLGWQYARALKITFKVTPRGRLTINHVLEHNAGNRNWHKWNQQEIAYYTLSKV